MGLDLTLTNESRKIYPFNDVVHRETADTIFNHLSVPRLVTFRRVCKGWKSYLDPMIWKRAIVDNEAFQMKGKHGEFHAKYISRVYKEPYWHIFVKAFPQRVVEYFNSILTDKEKDIVNQCCNHVLSTYLSKPDVLREFVHSQNNTLDQLSAHISFYIERSMEQLKALLHEKKEFFECICFVPLNKEFRLKITLGEKNQSNQCIQRVCIGLDKFNLENDRWIDINITAKSIEGIFCTISGKVPMNFLEKEIKKILKENNFYELVV